LDTAANNGKDGAWPSEGKGQGFESLRARHFGARLGTPRPSVFVLAAGDERMQVYAHHPMMERLRVHFDALGVCARVREGACLMSVQSKLEKQE
jgi:hypothetical protein